MSLPTDLTMRIFPKAKNFLFLDWLCPDGAETVVTPPASHARLVPRLCNSSVTGGRVLASLLFTQFSCSWLSSCSLVCSLYRKNSSWSFDWKPWPPAPHTSLPGYSAAAAVLSGTRRTRPTRTPADRSLFRTLGGSPASPPLPSCVASGSPAARLTRGWTSQLRWSPCQLRPVAPACCPLPRSHRWWPPLPSPS